MRPQNYSSKTLVELLRGQKIATLPQMKDALGTNSHMTVFRKLKEVGYRTSYSHRAQFYTLDGIPRFNDQGLWSHQGVWFSRFGSLVATAEEFVSKSEAGYFTRELDGILHVSTKKALQKLVGEEKLFRERLLGWYLYCAVDGDKRKEQVRARNILEAELILGHGLKHPQVSLDELKAAAILFYTLLNEKERRLCAGLESLKYGYGGDRKIADLLGIDIHTVAKGRRELLEGTIERDRIRKAGGGRKSIKKNARGGR